MGNEVLRLPKLPRPIFDTHVCKPATQGGSGREACSCLQPTLQLSGWMGKRVFAVRNSEAIIGDSPEQETRNFQLWDLCRACLDLSLTRPKFIKSISPARQVLLSTSVGGDVERRLLGSFSDEKVMNGTRSSVRISYVCDPINSSEGNKQNSCWELETTNRANRKPQLETRSTLQRRYLPRRSIALA